MILMALLGAGAFIVAGLILTGWLPLGERANILRSNLNGIEILMVIGAIVYGTGLLRTAWGILQYESASHRWTQWMSFLTASIGAVILFSVIVPTGLKFGLLLGQDIDIRGLIESLGTIPSLSMQIGELLLSIVLAITSLIALLALLVFLSPSLERIKQIPVIQWFVAPPSWLVNIIALVFLAGLTLFLIAGAYSVPEFPGRTTLRNPDMSRIIPALLLLITGGLSYRYARQVDDVSDDMRRAVSLTPGKAIRFELAKSPSAGAIIGFIVIFLGFTMATDLFIEQRSLASFLTNVSTKGIIAIGVTFLMISGEFDLSVGSILGVTAMVFMLGMTEGIGLFNLGVLDPLPAAIFALIVAAILGAINGIILIWTRIPSFIVTLGTLLAYRAITLVAIAGGRILRYRDYYDEFPQVEISPMVFAAIAGIGLLLLAYTAYRLLPVYLRQFQAAWAIRDNNGDFGTTTALWRLTILVVTALILFALAAWMFFIITFHLNSGVDVVQVGFFDILNGRISPESGILGSEVSNGLTGFEIQNGANFRLSIVWWLFFVVMFHVLLTSTAYGNSVFAAGGNGGAARAQGINVDRVKVQNFIIIALLTGVAAIYETASNPGVDPLKGDGWELEVIAMTVIGGALLTGGYGSVLGSLLGALIFGMLQTGLVLVGIESRLFSGTIGVIIIVAVVLNTMVRGGRRD